MSTCFDSRRFDRLRLTLLLFVALDLADIVVADLSQVFLKNTKSKSDQTRFVFATHRAARVERNRCYGHK